MNPKIDEVMEEEWWLESTKQCIQANIDHPTRESFENIIAHIRTLTKSLYQEVFEQGRKEGVQSAIEALPEEKDKKVEEILNDLFDAGKRYGEDIGYAKDEALYELRSSAIFEAKSSLTKLL